MLESRFFRTLVFNSMMSLTKSFFELTSYMENDKEYGEFWKLIHDEYKLTKKMLLNKSEEINIHTNSFKKLKNVLKKKFPRIKTEFFIFLLNKKIKKINI